MLRICVLEPGKIPRDELVESAGGALTAELQFGEEELGLGLNRARLADELLDAIDQGNH